MSYLFAGKNILLGLIISCILSSACVRKNGLVNTQSEQTQTNSANKNSAESDDQILTKTIDQLTPLKSYKITIRFFNTNAPLSQLIKANGKRVAEVNYDKPLVERNIYFYATASETGQIRIDFEKICIGEKRFYTEVLAVREDPPAAPIKDNVIILGDSITEGFPYFDISYPKLLAQKLNANSYKFSAVEIYDEHNKANVYNLGIQCEKLNSMLSRFEDAENRMIKNARNIFVIFGGSNNLGSDSAEEIERQIRQVCEKAKAAKFDRIYVVTITPRSDSTPQFEETRQRLNDNLRANYRRYADGIIDLAATKLFQDNKSDLYSEEEVKVHFSPAGDEVAASKFFEILNLSR